ncbi:MAG: DUF4339 domain-containing protein [Thermoguttaceae bacterium]
MATRWFVKFSDVESGPIPFHDLAGMVGDGRLTEDDWVRREIGTEWIRARNVLGLFRAAGKQPAPCEPPVLVEDETPRTPEPAIRVPCDPEPQEPRSISSRRRSFLVAGAIAFVAVAEFGGWWYVSRPRGIKPRIIRPPRREGTAVERVFPGPHPPSLLPGLSLRAPQLVPGLEDIEPAFTPTLTADMRTVVFSAKCDPGNDYDLFEATREDVSRPFGRPRLIEWCASPAMDAWPSLASDGLELVFLRKTNPPALWRATRQTRRDPFDAPQAVILPQAEIASRELGPAQWLDSLHFLVRTTYASWNLSLRIAERTRADGPFGSLRRIRFYNPLPIYFLSADRLRAYAGGPNGIFLTARASEDAEFDEGTIIASDSLTGPIDDQIWVSPQEDLIVYCSPGPGNKPGSARKLWIIRL